jgi:hypothetical protein
VRVPATGSLDSGGLKLRRRLPARPAVRLALITVAALGIRLYFFNQYVHQHPKQALAAIPFLFEPGNIAYSLALGHGFGSPFRVDTGPTAWMTPLYPMVLAGIFRIFGNYTFPAFVATALVNIVCSTFTCLAIFAAGRKIGGLGVGAIGAVLWAVFPSAIVFPYESFWDASLTALLASTLLWATVALAGSTRTREWYGYGLLWGLALMTSATLVSVFPFLLGWLTHRARQTDRHWLRNPALAAGVAILCCIPWTVRNYAVFHTLVPLRTVMGLSLWVGNNESADGLSPGRLHPISNSEEREKYVELGEIGYMSEKEDEAIRFMRSHPARELQLIKTRFVAIWAGGTPAPISAFLRARSKWFRWTLFFNIFLTLAGLAGIVVLYRRRSPYTFPAAVFPLIFPLAYYVTLAPPRYRHPMDPVLVLLSAISLQAIWQTINRGSAARSRTADNK